MLSGRPKIPGINNFIVLASWFQMRAEAQVQATCTISKLYIDPALRRVSSVLTALSERKCSLCHCVTSALFD